MRLTTELINSSLSYVNPLHELELDLRGNKIPAIENLGAARDHECIDLTDNEVATLGNFPLSPKLSTLLLARNRISTIQPSISRSIPNLITLNLSHNRIADLPALEPLSSLTKLKHLALLDNPVISQKVRYRAGSVVLLTIHSTWLMSCSPEQYYRHFVIALIPSLHFLDYQHVKKAERDKAKATFGTLEKPTAVFTAALQSAPNSEVGGAIPMRVNGAPAQERGRLRLSEKEKRKIREMINDAESLQEIAQLEKILEDGRIPPGLFDERDDGMEE